MRSLLLPLTLLPIAAMPSLAGAQTLDLDDRGRPEPAWAERPLSIEGHVGFGTLVGLAGATLEYAAVPELSVGAGLGAGSAGPQTAAVVRLRPVHGTRNALVLSGGYSLGPYREANLNFGMDHSGVDRRVEAGLAHWIQADVGWERRAESGFVIRVAAGIARLLNPGDLECTEVDPYEETTTWCSTGSNSRLLPTLTVTLGWAP